MHREVGAMWRIKKQGLNRTSNCVYPGFRLLKNALRQKLANQDVNRVLEVDLSKRFREDVKKQVAPAD